ncbi:hypothetical protein LOZ51_003931 [Ophidiomyces ophidiicola]|nr:hypothetical protein LOZ51_003931 [Ophidiomyces ophidiicola]
MGRAIEETAMAMENGAGRLEHMLVIEHPALLSKSYEEKTDLVLLSWILLLFRDSGLSESGKFSGEIELQGDAIASQRAQISGSVGDVISDDTELISQVLERIRSVRSCKAVNNSEEKEGSRCGYFSNASEDTNEMFCIKADLKDERVLIQLAQCPPLLSQSMRETYTDSLANILKSVMSDSTQTVAQAIEVTPMELEKIWQWNDPIPSPNETLMHEIFVENAVKHPNKPAVVSWDGQLSYGEVNALSTQLAIQLLENGVQVGEPILLCFEKCRWTVVAVLAVMKAGGALVLTDPSQPLARLQTIATEVNARIALTSKEQASLGATVAPNAIVLSVGQDLLQNVNFSSASPNRLPKIPGSSTLYIIFTSGSTGKPKGVVISHTNYTSGAIPRAAAVGYTPDSRVLDFPSYTFDVSIDCMLCTLANSGCICVPSEDQRVNDLDGAIKGMNVNIGLLTPSVARVLDPDIMASLDVLGLGGEAVSARDATQFGQKTKIIIAYGPSECTVGCTLDSEVGIDCAYTTIGKGVGCATWIVDPKNQNRLMPLGAVGELLIEGPIVGDGYLNNPEQTSTVFIESPPWLTAGAPNVPGRSGRLYKTGDLVKYAPDGSGSIIFVGRADQQVKLRGQRVELGEIEFHLRSKLPSDTMSAVEVITPGGNKESAMLVAFIAEKGKGIAQETNGAVSSFSAELQHTLATIQNDLAAVLPRYMVPATYIPLQKIPLLISGKTDRKKLRTTGSSMSRKELADLKIAPAKKLIPLTDLERSLQQLWMKILGEEIDINGHDNFFDVGGDSLRAMKLVAAARLKGLGITVADIFQHPTLSEMAMVLRQINTDNHVDISTFSLLSGWKETDARNEVGKLCGIDPSSIEDIYPCTPLQEGFMALSAKISEAYVAQRVVEIADVTKAVKVKAAFATCIAECPILRTRIIQVPRRGLMQVLISDEMSWYSGNDLQSYLQQDRESPMGLGTALARFALIEDQNTAKAHIVLTIHHAVYDGWSMPLVVERVNRAYHGLKTERSALFKSFIKYLGDMDRGTTEEYWKEQLHGATSLQFPVLPEPGYQAQAESLLEHYVAIKKRSSSNTSLATALRGAWALVASEYTLTDDVVFGETLTGRNAPIEGVEEIEGPMITTVPTRVRVDRNMRVSNYLKAIQDQGISQIPHEHLGLQHIRRLTPDAREACELRTGLVIHPARDPEDLGENEDNAANGFVPVGDKEAASEALKFNSYPLMLVCSLDRQGFLVMASFDSKAVDVAQMTKILEKFGSVVQQFCENPNGAVGDALQAAGEDVADLTRMSTVGPISLKYGKSTPLAKDLSNATATWIVHPTNPDHPLPIGAVGELLVEGPVTASQSPTDAPRWLIEKGSSKQLYKTGQLAKYQTDGAIIFVHETKSGNSKEKSSKASHVPKQTTSLLVREEKLLQLWSRVLGLSENEIDATDSFFDLGGDSISAMKLVSEARMEGFTINVAQIFKHKRLRDLASILQESQPLKTQTVKEDIPFSLLGSKDLSAFITSALQPKLSDQSWEIIEVMPARPLQTVAIEGTFQLPRYSSRYELFYFDTAVDETRLFESCQELVARNEILRTVFVEFTGRYYSVVLKRVDVSIEIHDTENDVETFSRELCNTDIEKDIPLGSSFVKFLFVRCTDGRSCLILQISHAQYDEICLPILLRQLSALYEKTEVPRALPFSSYVHHVVKENIPQSIQYWRDLLKGSSLTTLRPEAPLQSKVSAAVIRTFDISARSKDITVATLPTAAWALCLAKRLCIRDVTFGEVVSGRNIDFPNSNIVMGPCWQYVPVRVKFEAGWTAMDLLQFVQRQHITSTRFEGMGLSEIVENCTEWPKTVDWFDSVVHQDVEHVETLGFSSATSRMETIYPHAEPLREWKIQAFLKNNELSIEIVTFESWLECASTLLDDIEKILGQLLREPHSPVFEN